MIIWENWSQAKRISVQEKQKGVQSHKETNETQHSTSKQRKHKQALHPAIGLETMFLATCCNFSRQGNFCRWCHVDCPIMAEHVPLFAISQKWKKTQPCNESPGTTLASQSDHVSHNGTCNHALGKVPRINQGKRFHGFGTFSLVACLFLSDCHLTLNASKNNASHFLYFFVGQHRKMHEQFMTSIHTNVWNIWISWK